MHFSSKSIHKILLCSKNPQIWHSFVIFKELPKENNRPIGEKAPNLVTLLRFGCSAVVCVCVTVSVGIPLSA
jgi:hypothetical protein